MSLRHLGNRYISTASVPEFLRFVQDAEYVISNSFHGVAFSLIFQKQFFAVGMGEKAKRVKTLLVNAGIPERYLDTASVCTNKINTIDYQKVSDKLRLVIDDSKQYLTSTLK